MQVGGGILAPTQHLRVHDAVHCTPVVHPVHGARPMGWCVPLVHCTPQHTQYQNPFWRVMGWGEYRGEIGVCVGVQTPSDLRSKSRTQDEVVQSGTYFWTPISRGGETPHHLYTTSVVMQYACNMVGDTGTWV